MSLALNKIHEYQKVPGSLEVRLVKVTPAICIGVKDQPPIFIQDGKFYYEDGKVVRKLPEWAEVELAKLSDEAKSSVGLK